MNLDAFNDSALAGLATLLITWLGTRTEAFQKWMTKNKATRMEKRAMPGHIAMLVTNDARRTEQFEAISEKITVNTDILAAQNRALADLSAVTYGQMMQDPNPRFVCDNDGSNRMVNTAYARLLKCGRDELSGYGYRRFMPESLNPGFISGFEQAAKQHRTYEADVLVRRADDTLFWAHVMVVPHPEDIPPATHWNGVLRYLREDAQK